MSHPFAQTFAAASADEAEFGPIVCEGCEEHQNSDDDLREVDGKWLCEDCDPNWPPKNLTDVATRKFGLREDGGRL